MKKLTRLFVFASAAAMLAGCTPSNIENEETSFVPDGLIINTETAETWTTPPPSSYTIPDDAETGENGGPGAMSTTAVDYSYYPKGKRPEDQETTDSSTLVILYRYESGWIDQDFDAVDVCDADSLIAALIKNGAFKEGTEVESFEVTDGHGALVLNEINLYYEQKDDLNVVLVGIANTFIDNLQLDDIEITVGDEDYGTFTFSREYDL